MWLRRAFFWWLLPSAFVLPFWLFVGWIISGASAWALLWMFIAIPSVFVAQLLLTLLVRARGTVRAERAVSWWDVAGFGLWHVLTVVVGLYNDAFLPALVSAIGVAIALFWLELWQLFREARPKVQVLHAADGTAYIPPAEERTRPQATPDVIILEEKSPRDER